MGSHEPYQFDRKDGSLQACANILIVASPEHAAAIDWPAREKAFPGLTVLPCALDERIPAAAASAAELVILEIDPANTASMDRLAALKRQAPRLPVIAAIADVPIALVRTLLREGVADVVSLPLHFDDVLGTCLEVMANRARRGEDQVRLAPMFAVVRSIGGCGATSIATHLAAELAATTASGAALVDLDLQFGSAADYLAAAGQGSVVDLIEAKERLDEDLVRSVARQTSNNVAVFAAPDTVMPLETIEADRLLAAIDRIRRIYGYVVLDLPANWTNWTLSAVAEADQLLMVVELSVPSLRQAKRRLDLFQSVGIADDRVGIVVNRVEKRLFRTIDLDDVEATLGRPVLGSVALDDHVVSSAQDQGLLVGQLHRKSKFAQDIAKLAAGLGQRFSTGGI